MHTKRILLYFTTENPHDPSEKNHHRHRDPIITLRTLEQSIKRENSAKPESHIKMSLASLSELEKKLDSQRAPPRNFLYEKSNSRNFLRTPLVPGNYVQHPSRRARVAATFAAPSAGRRDRTATSATFVKRIRISLGLLSLLLRGELRS